MKEKSSNVPIIVAIVAAIGGWGTAAIPHLVALIEPPPIEQSLDAQKLLEGGFLLGISYTWASASNEPGNFVGAETNFRLAKEALTASNAFTDMSPVNSISTDLDLKRIADSKEFRDKVSNLKENLSGQLANKYQGKLPLCSFRQVRFCSVSARRQFNGRLAAESPVAQSLAKRGLGLCHLGSTS